MINKMKLIVPALSKNESFCRSLVAAFCVELSPTLEEINDIKTAVSEAVTNAVVHGYEAKRAAEGNDIEIETELFESEVKIVIIDHGCGIENVDEAMQPFFTTRPEDERSGMGFTVMQTFMDKIDVFSEKGKGTTLIMIKKIGSDKC